MQHEEEEEETEFTGRCEIGSRKEGGGGLKKADLEAKHFLPDSSQTAFALAQKKDKDKKTAPQQNTTY